MADVPSYAVDLMRALGPQTVGIEWVGFDRERAAWSVGFDDPLPLVLEWFAEQEAFMVLASLGVPPAQGRLAAYEAVLAYNTLWRDNGGARVGLVGADGELALMVELPARDLTLDQLRQVVLGVKAQAAAWARCVAHPGGEDTPDPAAWPSPSHRV